MGSSIVQSCIDSGFTMLSIVLDGTNATQFIYSLSLGILVIGSTIGTGIGLAIGAFVARR